MILKELHIYCKTVRKKIPSSKKIRMRTAVTKAREASNVSTIGAIYLSFVTFVKYGIFSGPFRVHSWYCRSMIPSSVL